MALDGIVISNIVHELNQTLINGRLYKIAQPESDELMLTIKGNSTQYRLTVSANASLPLIYLVKENKQSPITAPNFCMLLRKHINNGRIISITQPGLERIIDFEVEHLNEMGDLCRKHLIVEIMGKHSNIIFCDSERMIIDSIKHVSSQMSSIREVLPGRTYFIPDTMEKQNPLDIDEKGFIAAVCSKPMPLSKAVYTSLTGISPITSEEICFQASINSDMPANTITSIEQVHLYNIFIQVMNSIKLKEFMPNIIYNGNVPIEFSSIELNMYKDKTQNNLDTLNNTDTQNKHTSTNNYNSQNTKNTYFAKQFDSISEVLRTFYSTKETITRIRQKSFDLRRIVSTALERNNKKYDIMLKQLKDTDKKDKFKVYGELINTYGYNIPEGSKSFDALNYYTNETITIPLDETITAKENAVKYFDRYNKLKRTFEATTKLIEETGEEIRHLESISASIDIAQAEEDLVQLKEELIEYGYIKRKDHSGKKIKITSKPFHYVSSDGFHMYVGKNNYQNDELTFKFASGGDWWFHAKNMPGSHVIVKCDGAELPDKTFEEAASLAAYYSKSRSEGKVEVDYIQKKQIKKPASAKPGFVVYYTNYSLIADTDISNLREIDD